MVLLAGETLQLELELRATCPGPSHAKSVVLVLDGEVWLQDDLLINSLHQAIGTGRIPPIQLVLLHAGGAGARRAGSRC